MADPVANPRRGLPPPANGKEPPADRPPPQREPARTYRGRFGISYVVLALVLAGAGAGTYFATKGKQKHAQARLTGHTFYTRPARMR